MKTNFDFYDSMTDNEKQICDLCRDWNLGVCERCKITSLDYFKMMERRQNAMKVVLYTIECPNCIVLEKKLKQKNIEFLKVSDKETIKAKGFGDSHFPILDVDGVVMNYKTAIKWIKSI